MRIQRKRFLAGVFAVPLLLGLLPLAAASQSQAQETETTSEVVEVASNQRTDCLPGDRPETGLQGAVPGFERQPPDGFQGFWCRAVKVGQHALFDRGSYGDTQLISDEQRGICAYSSMRTPSDLDDPNTGTMVLDTSVASEPEVVQILRTPAMLRAYSGFEIQGNTMVAARQNSDEFDVYDVSGDCLQPQFLSTTTTAGHNHDGWLTPDEKTYYGIPFGGPGPDEDPNRIDVHVMDLSDRTNPQHLLNWNRLELPPEVYERTFVTNNFHDVSTNDDGTRLYLGLYGAGSCANGLLILDSSDVAERRPNPQLRYISFLSWCDQQIDPDFGDGSSASTHTTEYVIHENGKEYIVTTDEGPALRGSAEGMCTQTTYSRFIDISDERNPRVVSTFKPDVNKPENCERNLAENTTGGMVHYVGFDDRYNMRLVFYAASNQGIRVVDFKDPENPKEIAYYVKERHHTTPVTGTDFTRPDPRYDPVNCFIYTGWNQGGLVIIELTDPEYNPCMRKTATGGGRVTDGDGDQIQFSFNVRGRTAGPTGQFRLKAPEADIRLDEVNSLGSVRDECGSVFPNGSALQFEGTGTFNGADAEFQICVEDNGDGKGADADLLFVACTSGCDYRADHTIAGGNIQVRWPTNGYTHQNTEPPTRPE